MAPSEGIPVLEGKEKALKDCCDAEPVFLRRRQGQLDGGERSSQAANCLSLHVGWNESTLMTLKESILLRLPFRLPGSTSFSVTVSRTISWSLGLYFLGLRLLEVFSASLFLSCLALHLQVSCLFWSILLTTLISLPFPCLVPCLFIYLMLSHSDSVL